MTSVTDPQSLQNPNTPEGHWRSRAMLCLVPLVVLIGYWPILFNGFVDFDDNLYITANKNVASGLTLESVASAFTATVAANWHPVTMLSHMLDVWLFGLDPFGHHAVSLLLAMANALLLTLVLARLTGSFERAVVVGLIFAAHPIHVESIAWASSRKDLLSLFFALLAIAAYQRWTVARSAGRYALVMLLFTLALMSKPSIITLPAVLVLLDFWPLNRAGASAPFDQALRAYLRKLPVLIFEKAGLWLVCVAFSVTVFLVQRASGAVDTGASLTGAARVLNAVVAYARYLKKLFWPDDLVFLYHHPVWWPAGVVIAAFMVLLGVSIAIGFAARRWDKRYLPVGWLWFLGAMVPMIGLVQVGSQSMADRYGYFPFIGLYIVLVWSVGDMLAGLRHARQAATVAVALCVSVLCVLTNRQARVWQDSVTLFTHLRTVAGSHAHAENNMGVVHNRNNRPDLAADCFERAIKARPDSAPIYVNYAKALIALNRLEEAQASYIKALELDRSQLTAWLGLGLIQAGTGRYDEAERTYRGLIDALPDKPQGYFYLAQIRARGNDTAEAKQLYRLAIEKDPAYADAYNSLGALLAREGNLVEAREMFAKAVALSPDDQTARENLDRARGMLREQSEE